MKKFLISTLLLVGLVSTSCNNKNSPKEVATTWLNSFYHLDYETAKKLSTEDTKNILATLQQFTTMIPDSMKKDTKKVVITIKDLKEDGDKAVATYTTSNDPKEQSLPLVKQGGKWLVQWSKSDMSGMGAGAADSTGAEQPGGADSTAPSGGSMADSSAH
jgi:thioredoxin-related protein